MSTVRDWLTTLWPGSYKGVAFYFDKEEAEGGRDLVKHQFPHRDDPFIEDMGEALREYTGDIYVHGDDADTTSAALEETLASMGPGILVVPIRGPILVHCERFKRVHDKDKLGLVAFNVKFVRNGAATALISIPFAARMVIDAADRLAAALAGTFAAKIGIVGQADYVVSAAADGVAQVAAALDVTRQTWSVDPLVSAQVRDAVSAIIDAAQSMIARTAPTAADVAALVGGPLGRIVDTPAADGPTFIVQSVIATARALAAGMSPISAQAAFAAFADGFAAPVETRLPLSRTAALARANATAVDQLARLAALSAWCEALAARPYASRPEGITARAEAADRFDAELNAATGAENAALFVAIEELRGRIVDYLSRLITDLAPVVEVEASASMPSLYWAWRLYADPARASDLVARNSVRHPSFMPLSFSALAPR